MYSPRDQYIPMSQSPHSSSSAFGYHHPSHMVHPHYMMHQTNSGQHTGSNSSAGMISSPSPSSSPYFFDLSPRDIVVGLQPPTISPRPGASSHDWSSSPFTRSPSSISEAIGFKWNNGKQSTNPNQSHHNIHGYNQGNGNNNCNISLSPPPSPPNSYLSPTPSPGSASSLRNRLSTCSTTTSITTTSSSTTLPGFKPMPFSSPQQQQLQHLHSHEDSSPLYSSPISSPVNTASSSTNNNNSSSSINSDKKLMSRVIVPLLNLKQSRPQEAPTVSPKSPCIVPDDASFSPHHHNLHHPHHRPSPPTPTYGGHSSPPASPGSEFAMLTTSGSNGRIRSNSNCSSSSTASTPRSTQDYFNNLSLSSAPTTPRTNTNNNNNNTNSLSSSSSTTTTTSIVPQDDTTNNNQNNELYLKKAEEQWKKLEYFSNDFNHFVFEIIKNKEFHQLSTLNTKLGEITNTVQEIEITNNIFKTLPPQTRARKKRATKAEKLKKSSGGVLGVKRTYVTTPKSKGNYCVFCGTMETPEWRKGPGGHKTLCNACGLHYAKNLKREGALAVKSSKPATTTDRTSSTDTSANNNHLPSTSPSSNNSPSAMPVSHMNVASLLTSNISDD